MKIDIRIYLAVGETLLISFDRIIVTVIDENIKRNPKILCIRQEDRRLDISTDVETRSLPFTRE